MGFFEDTQQAGESALRARPRPVGVLPTPVAIRLLLARTEQAAVAIIGLSAFVTGFDLLVSVQLREAVPGTSDASFLGALDDQPLEEGFLRLGVQFSTGEKTTNMQLAATRGGGSEAAGPIMKVRGAGGGLLDREWRYWVSPLPVAGRLAFVCEWPAFGIPESSMEIDGQVLVDAASESLELWKS
jgi:hypothetical protein